MESSMQSSSGGDEEYDSRADQPISAFYNDSRVAPMPNQPPPPHHRHLLHQTQNNQSVFDPLSNYFDNNTNNNPLSSSSNPMNLDMVWSKALRSDPNHSDILTGFTATSSSQTQQLVFNNQDHNQSRTAGGLSQILNTTTNPVTATATATVTAKNPKKRSRASRRAPTTVLTTDTTNFRAMVQEFTGIPSPPFTSSTSAFPMRNNRFDLFGGTTNLSSSPSYLLRPFAQKLNLPVVPQSQTQNYQSTLLNMNTNNNNGVINFQSLLQNTTPKYCSFSGSSSVPGNNNLGDLQSLADDVGLMDRNINNNDEVGLLRSVNGGYSNPQTVMGSNLDTIGHGEKVQENKSMTMVESWICSSD